MKTDNSLSWGDAYLALQKQKYKMLLYRLKYNPPVRNLEKWEISKPNCKIIGRIQFTKNIIFENGEVFRYYFEDNTTKWLFLYQIIKNK